MTTAAPNGRLGILHIGPMKTGSTSIQRWLTHNSAALEAEGVHLLRPRSVNASALVRTFAADGGAKRKQRKLPANGISKETFQKMLEAIPEQAHTCVLSGELLGHSMKRPAIARLKEALEPYFDRWVIIIYLRRQADLAVSRFSTTARRGQRMELKNPFDYRRVLDDWAAEFGEDAIRPRLFDRAELVEGDVVSDFRHVAGLPKLANEKAASEHNPSLKPEAQALLEALAKKTRSRRTNFFDMPGRGTLIRLLDSKYAGTGRMPSRPEVQAFMKRVHDDNERVRARWFPNRKELFSEDYSRFPEVSSPPPTDKEMLNVAMDALVNFLVKDPSGKQQGGRVAAKKKGVQNKRRVKRKTGAKGAATGA